MMILGVAIFAAGAAAGLEPNRAGLHALVDTVSFAPGSDDIVDGRTIETFFNYGEVLGWGWNAAGQCLVPPPNNDFVEISAGGHHSLGQLSDGSLIVWGRITEGQGNIPHPNTGWLAFSTGKWHCLGLRADGSVAAWGWNQWGQCEVPEPNTGFVAVAGAGDHSLALRANGSIVAWGRNLEGQCDVPEPNTGFVAIAANEYHSLGLKANGSIVAWGYNESGACNIPYPNGGFVAISAGGFHSLGLKNDGSIRVWGGYQNYPPGPNSGFMRISAGHYHSIAMKTDSQIVAWGDNDYGQCDIPGPGLLLQKVSAGWAHNLGILVGPVSIDQVDGPAEPGIVDLPSVLEITGAAPNPFNPLITVSFELPAAATVSVRIHDMAGRLVRTLVHEPVAAGSRQVSWDGRDDTGRSAPGGVYLVRLTTADGYSRVAKITLAK